MQDPTTDPDPLEIGIQRSYRADASGRMVLSPVGATTDLELRVPGLVRAARGVGHDVVAATPRSSGSANVKFGSLALKGNGVSQGDLTEGDAYESTRLDVPAPGHAARKMATCSSTQVVDCIGTTDDRSADLRYVGSASDVPRVGAFEDGLVTFGVNSWGAWRTPASYTEFDVLLDGDRDGTGRRGHLQHPARDDRRLRLLRRRDGRHPGR